MIGSRIWAISAGCIPAGSSGTEPLYTSRNTLCILNVNDNQVRLKMTIYFAEREPAGPYLITVGSRRVRHLRINDLIDPEPVMLETAYAVVIESDFPVVVQFIHLDTSSGNAAMGLTMAYSV